jgi:hypothetical protein
LARSHRWSDPLEESGGSPELTKNEVELVRFLCEGSFDWRAFLAAQR